MPNNGIISRQAVIPNEFLVESADSTDLVIINTPTTGNKVQQKAVPVSALGGGGSTLPFHSVVYQVMLDGTTNASVELYNDIPTSVTTFTLNAIHEAPPSNEVTVSISCTSSELINLRQAMICLDGVLNGATYQPIKNVYDISFVVVDDILLSGSGSVIELRIYNLNI